MHVRLNLINEFAIEVDGQVVRRLRTRKTEELLAYLALHPQRWHARAELMDLLWPEDDEQAGRRKLRLALHSIRSLIGDVLHTDGDLVRTVGVEVDVNETDLLSLGVGWRLMPEHQIEWLDLIAATSQAQQQFEAVTTLTTGESGDRAAQLAYLIAAEPSEAGLYVKLYRHYVEAGSRVAASVVAGIARLNLGAGCPAELAATPVRLRSDFCGRLRELAHLADRLLGPDEPALAQINGLGGLGKTRLARELAALAPGEDIMVMFVNLSGREEAQTVTESALAAGLGLTEEELRDPAEIASALLILDNADTIAPGGLSFLSRYQTEGCGMRVLVTSQQRRADAGEALTLGPLSLPRGADASAAEQSDTVQLIVHHSSHALNPENCAALISLAHDSGGIPLAAIMMAMECRRRPLDTVATELRAATHNLKFRHAAEVESPRHLSLNATLTWSFDQLADDSQSAALKLSWIEDEFDEAILSTLGVAPEDRDALADSGWVVPTGSRLNMPPPVRQFLRERQPDNELRTREVIRDFLVGEMNVHYPGDFARVGIIAETYQADFDYYEARATNPTDQGALLVGLQVTSHRYGRVDRFLRNMRQVIAAEPRADWVNLLASTHYIQHEFDLARPLYEQNIDHLDAEIRGVAQSNLSLIRLSTGDPEGAINLLKQSINATTHPRRRATRVLNLGSATMMAGRFDEARELVESALAEFEESGTLPGFIALCHLRLAEVELLAGHFEAAQREALIARDGWEAIKQWSHVTDTHALLVLVSAALGRPSEIVEWLDSWASSNPPVPALSATCFVALHLLKRADLAAPFAVGIVDHQAPLIVSALARQQKLVFARAEGRRLSRSDALALARQAVKRL